MKKIFSLITRFFAVGEDEIQEAPRFEEWYHQMFPRDTYNPKIDEFHQTLMEFRKEQHKGLTS